MKKELRGWDRVQALIRNPEYLKEYKEFSKLKEFEDQDYFSKRENLLKKWELLSPINPEEHINKNKPKYVRVFSDNSYNDLPVNPLPFKKDSKNTHYLREKKYLKIEVDLTFGKKKIIDDVEVIVKEFQSILAKDTGRNAETVHSPWKIYDMRHQQGMNLSQIAQELSGIYDNPSYNAELMVWYKQVRRAYKKALMMIDRTKNI